MLQRRSQSRPVINLDQPVAALALLLFAGEIELDQLRLPRVLLPELQTTPHYLEVGVALKELAAVLGAER